MRLVFAHVDRVVVERTERVLDASLAAGADAPASVRATDALVAFVSVESGDDADATGVVAAAAEAVRTVAERLRVDDVVLYPETASSVRPAAASAAAPLFADLVDALEAAAFAATAAAFGWRRRLEVAAKAHPFATDARTIRPGDGPDDDAAAEWTVVVPEGDRLDPERFLDDWTPPRAVSRVVRASVDSLRDPPHALGAPSGEAPPDRGDRAVALDVADRDPLAPGARWRPVGAFLRDAIAAAVADRVPADAMPVRGPPAVDLTADATRAYAADCGARGHGVTVDDRRVLPDAFGCASALATLADVALDATESPLSLFDRDAPGPLPAPSAAPEADDVAAFVPGETTAPALHVAVPNPAAARDVVVDRVQDAFALASAAGVDAVAVCRVTPSVREARGDWFEALATRLDAPVLVAETPNSGTPWPLRVDLLAPTADGDALATGTVAVDAESARHFRADDAAAAVGSADATDAAATGDGAHPTVVHAAPAGSLAATVAAVLDAPAVAAADRDGAATGEAGPRPFPSWLAPTQVRLVPVATDHVERCEAIADALAGADVRVDVDDRELPVGDRIERAVDARVPRFVVVGDDEHADGPLPVTDVATGRERALSVDALAAAVDDAVGDRPRSDRPVPRRLSRRPRLRR